MISPGLRIGRYEVGARLGKGSFGVVHAARDVELGREVALKVLKPEFVTKPQVVQRFLKEARAAATIGHPGIVTVFEAGQITGTGTKADGNAYIAMELLRGASLTERFEDRGKLAPETVIAIGRQLANALAAAHAAGIIHRDLKPDNVYLVKDAAVVGGERVKILDFGVAKLAEPADAGGVQTHSKIILGTPRYMSPEQARSAGKVDHRSDIYALGVMLYELLCGRPPFSGDAGDVIQQHQQVPVRRASSIVEMPPALDELIAKMLAKTPDDRPQSMADVEAALANAEPADDLEEPTLRADGDLDDLPTVSQDTVPGVRAPRPVRAAVRDAAPATLVDRFSASPSGDAASPGGAFDPAPVGRPPVARRTAWPAPAVLGLAFAGLALGGLATYLLMRGDRREVSANAQPAATIDAQSASVAPSHAPAPSDASAAARDVDAAVDRTALAADCQRALASRAWETARTCAEQLRELDATAGTQIAQRAAMEAKAEAALYRLDLAIGETALKRAKQELDAIPADSVFAKTAAEHYTRAERLAAETAAARARTEARNDPKPPTDSKDPKEPAKCDVAELLAQGDAEVGRGNHARALQRYEAALRCRPDTAMVTRAYMAACNSRDEARARVYYNQLSLPRRQQLAQICIRNGIRLE